MNTIGRRGVLRALSMPLAAGLLPAFAAAQGDKPSDKPGDKRIVLVIGNGAYKSAPLKNPVSDARAVADSLKQLDYEVTLRENTTLVDLIEALRSFSLRAATSSVRLLFYAGHGIQAKGRNYLLPVDVEPQSEDEIATKTADVNELLDRLGNIKHGLNIVVPVSYTHLTLPTKRIV